MLLRLVLALSVVTAAVPAAAGSVQATPWYRKARAVDLTGTNPRDSVVLVASGKRADSLAISMTFYVNGVVVHRQPWTSEDELADADSLRKSPSKLNAYMRMRLDAALTTVKREKINAEQVQHMGDVAALRKITPKPTHQIALSFGFENSLYFVWDPVRRKMVLFMECC